MPQPQPPVLSDIFAAYIALRQSGHSMDEAVEQLTPQANELASNDRNQLGKYVSSWEANNGANFRPNRKRVPEPQVEAQAPAASQRQATQSVIRPIEPLTAPGVEFQLCPNCHKKNKLAEAYCFACGHILKVPTGNTRQIQDLDDQARWGTARFGARSSLFLAVRGAPQPIKIPLRDEMIIGRSSSASALGPDIDLAPYGAEKLGVSRLHAALKRTGNTISLMDLQSSNLTFVNGQRMYAHEVRVLRDGDEIRLGKLVIKVIFRH